MNVCGLFWIYWLTCKRESTSFTVSARSTFRKEKHLVPQVSEVKKSTLNSWLLYRQTEPVWRFFGTVVVRVNSWLKIAPIRLSHRGCTGGLSHSSRSAEEHDSLRPQTNARQSQGAAPPAAKRFIGLYWENRSGSFFVFTHTDDFFFFSRPEPRRFGGKVCRSKSLSCTF